MKNFLIPIDFSRCSETTFNYAVKIAKATESKITLLHVADSEHLDNVVSKNALLKSNADQVFGDLHTSLNRWAEIGNRELQKVNEDLIVETIVLSGKPADEIINHINENHYDLVFVAAKGGGKIRQIMGSLAVPILDNTSKPILFVPDKDGLDLPKEILFATDFKDHDVDSLKTCFKLFNPIEYTLSLLHLSEDEDLVTDKNMLDLFIEDVQSDFPYQKMGTKILPRKNNNDMTIHLTDKQNGWLSMSTHPRTFWEKLVNPSISRRLITNIEQPILMFRDS